MRPAKHFGRHGQAAIAGSRLNALLYLHQVLAVIAVVIAVGVSGWLVARRQAQTLHQR